MIVSRIFNRVVSKFLPSLQPGQTLCELKVKNIAIQSWRKQRRKDRKMESLKTYLVKFFGVAIRGQTYLNALYLFLAFPLGLVYFIFLMVGLSSGIGLTIVWVGLLILLVVFITWTALAAFERQMAIWLLREEIPPMSRQDLSGLTLWQQFKATVTNPVTWKGLVYLLAKFPWACCPLSCWSLCSPFRFLCWQLPSTTAGSPTNMFSP